MVKTESIGQEVSALDKRTRTISRSGIVFLISGLVTLVVAGIGYAISRLLSPGVNDFMIDVPALLIPSAGHGDGSDLFSSAMPFTSAFSGYLSSPIFIAVPVALVLVYAVLKVFNGEGVTSVLPLLTILPVIFGAKMILGVFIETPEDDSSPPTEVVRQLIKDDKPAELVAYLEKINGKIPETAKLLDYVKAQASIRENKPDIDLVRKVVADYQRNPAEPVPADVRYGLEMTAFKETITPPATRYAQGKLKKARFFTSVSSAGFSISGILVLLGGMLFLWGAQMKKRVAFIKDVALK
ncbi:MULTISPECIES: klaC [Enterobacteriaceae]|uniref:KlaC n=1 Tax=Escherichia coli TaxID=562 RepID=A0ABD5C1S0_ECOLX|nr:MULTISPECIES: klaC [Enterobacteriaceae]HDO0381047.1 klaC [Salmonella enterica subsp. enterica serovar Typhimurium]MDR6046564.1 klaC [Escherichia coli]HAI0019015.1 klaC [Escherichia coli]HBO6844416.1 klaC [Escherichia coli]HDO2375969.1 klaC [Salmonella enterica subsp. enterica serovar Typhimurium]